MLLDLMVSVVLQSKEAVWLGPAPAGSKSLNPSGIDSCGHSYILYDYRGVIFYEHFWSSDMLVRNLQFGMWISVATSCFDLQPLG